MKPDAAEKAKAAKRGKERNKRNAIKKTDVMNNLRHWLAFVGEDGIEAAQRTARKTLHPDAGGADEVIGGELHIADWQRKRDDFDGQPQ